MVVRRRNHVRVYKLPEGRVKDTVSGGCGGADAVALWYQIDQIPQTRGTDSLKKQRPAPHVQNRIHEKSFRQLYSGERIIIIIRDH